ncbi:hypothetical protein ACHAXA_010836 [Cyclostephanos tholiformis]|uniref:Uncharacterized protein n=1 Tax=Cyclostephanos tholiformis TaxID=382380 RepID=A0ABD3SG71_9STRA
MTRFSISGMRADQQPPTTPRDDGVGPTMKRRGADFIRGFFPNSMAPLDSPTASATGSSGRDSSHASSPESAFATPRTPSGTAMMATSAIGGSPHADDDACAATRRVLYDDGPASGRGHGVARIHHTALLLGLVDGAIDDEDSNDDEREWNATFSLDELDNNNGQRATARWREGDGDDVERGTGGDDAIFDHRAESTTYSGGDNPMTSINSERGDDNASVVVVASSSTRMPMQQKPPRHPTAYSRSSSSVNTREKQPRPAAYLVRASSNVSRRSLMTTTPRDHHRNDDIEQLSKQLQFGSDAWRKEEEEKKAYFDDTPRLKKYDSFEHKKKMATMKALAMKERASSALASKANRAKEKVKETIMKKSSFTGESGKVQMTLQQQGVNQEQGLLERLEQPKGMEITTIDNDEIDDMSQVSDFSDGFVIDRSIYASVTKSFKSKLSLSAAKISRNTNNTKSSLVSSKVTQVASTKLRSSKLAVLDMIKDPLLQNAVNNSGGHNMEMMKLLAVTSKTSSTPALLYRPTDKNMAFKTRQRFAVLSHDKEEVDSVLTMDGDITLNATNSEGASSVQRDLNCSNINIADVSSTKAHTLIAPHHSFSTPRAMTIWKNCANLQARYCNDTDITPPMSNITRNVGRHDLRSPVSPPIVAQCLSDVSSQTGTKSRIDANGFLVSPNSSFDRGWDGAASATVGSDGTFDPNSYIFLSPLSNHDFDDPDYGMPDLLSRSNCRNGVVLDSAGPVPCPPGDAKSTVSMMTLVSPSVAVSERLSLLPQSSRLLPSSTPKLSPSAKTKLKNMKIGGEKKRIGINKTSPILSRSVTSTF